MEEMGSQSFRGPEEEQGGNKLKGTEALWPTTQGQQLRWEDMSGYSKEEEGGRIRKQKFLDRKVEVEPRSDEERRASEDFERELELMEAKGINVGFTVPRSDKSELDSMEELETEGFKAGLEEKRRFTVPQPQPEPEPAPGED
jgi:hypothetical protein